jgi:ABC-2 type transport system permease protein
MIRPILAVPLRLLALMGKEFIETIRRPGAIVSLILGPFLIMAVFGLGYNGVRRPLETIVVVPPSTGLSTDAATYQELAGGGMHIVDVSSDRTTAEARLRDGTVDVVIVAPDDPRAAFEAGRQSVIEVLIDAIDPVEYNYAGFLASGLANAVNQQIIEQVATDAEGYAVARVGPQATTIPPSVVAAPTRAEVLNAAPTTPSVLDYFGPAVLALILQHLAVTLVALSLVRERRSGVMELFRIAPVSTSELLVGKILAFGMIGALIAVITLALLTGVLGIPILGTTLAVAVVVGLLLLASLGLGLLIAVVSDSERQAVQLSLLVLLASVFFSGFVLSIDEFTEPVRAIAYMLPVTHGIRLLQDVMLRGGTVEVWQSAALGIIAALTLTAAWIGMRRSMAPA